MTDKKMLELQDLQNRIYSFKRAIEFVKKEKGNSVLSPKKLKWAELHFTDGHRFDIDAECLKVIFDLDYLREKLKELETKFENS